MEKKSFKPQLKSINQIQEFVEKNLTGIDNKNKIYKINILVEEIVVNIINHAYSTKDPDQGNIIIEIEGTGEKVFLKILDDGMPFNLLKAKTPDINAPLKNRKPGGLGIFFVKQIAEKIDYSYENNQNCITMEIRI